ncbi:MAG: hypothetical protein IH968_12480 [Gemmatimonadetes bacterium]|nr:hypothetical protein [Gemmatimonadota bacterium]
MRGATLLTKIVGTALIAVAGVLVVIAGILTVLAFMTMSRAAEARSDLQDSRTAFDEAVINMQAACGLYCRPNLDEPTCA